MKIIRGINKDKIIIDIAKKGLGFEILNKDDVDKLVINIFLDEDGNKRIYHEDIKGISIKVKENDKYEWDREDKNSTRDKQQSVQKNTKRKRNYGNFMKIICETCKKEIPKSDG